MKNRWSRRDFLQGSISIATSFYALQRSASCGALAADSHAVDSKYGPLVHDPKGLLDLPVGFSYQVIATGGEKMSDGYLTPGKPDGMATFAGPDGLAVIVMNHEMLPHQEPGPFGEGHSLLKTEHRSLLYDQGPVPHRGGTTTMVYDTKQQKKVRHYLSLAGTTRNCAGGPTPWNSWITCEETVITQGDKVDYDTGRKYSCQEDHGFNFEVPAQAEPKLFKAVPLKEMGRFNHEAIAVDPQTGIVYQTEDRDNGLIYRFIPNTPGKLVEGGRLQALCVADTKPIDTRNWSKQRFTVGEPRRVEWIDMEDVLSPEDDLRDRGFEAGAAKFARGEGMWYSEGQIFFACTNGGKNKTGQIWRYLPDENNTDSGQLELFVEPNDSALLEAADNLTMAPWGDLMLCEDRSGEVVRLIGITMEGQLYTFALNHVGGEFAGVTFSPDGSTLFVNLQTRDLTLAITGPWQQTS